VEFVVFPFPLYFPPFISSRLPKRSKPRRFIALWLRYSQAIIATRPFRSLHHTISDAGLVGGGTVPKPGEVSLAHNGVFFLA
jgi:magnesium chelatase family protein